MEQIIGIPEEEYRRTPYTKFGGFPEGEGPGGPEGGPGGPEGGPGGPGEQAPTYAAIEICDGKLSPDSCTWALQGGQVSDTCAAGVRLAAERGDLGGVYVSGSGSDFTVEDAFIRLRGEGAGLGGKCSGAAVENGGKLTLRRCDITMDGKLRCATSCGGNSVLKVYDSTIWSHGDPWDHREKEVTWVMGPGMAKPPVYLEIEGNMRTHCTVMDSETYFYNSTVVADSWAALSTDAGGDRVYLEANDCKIITTDSGYGTYADTNCHCVLNRCDMVLRNMAAIVAGESSVQLNDCTAKCGSYIVMNHVVGGGPMLESCLTQVSNIQIHGGRYHCQSAAVVVKSNNADVVFDNAQITSIAGVLLESKLNEDPCAPDPAGRPCYGIHAVLRNLDTDNSIHHGDPNRMMEVRMENSTLRGAITGGAILRMDAASHWLATADSDVTLMGQFGAGQIDAAEGVTITAVAAQSGQVRLPSGGLLRMNAARQ